LKILYAIIPSLIIFSVILISNPFPVEAQTSPTHFASVKAVVVFEHTANLNQIKNVYSAVVKPQLITLINDYSVNVDNFSFETHTTDEALYVIGFNEQTGKTIYELYPKSTFYGTLPDGVTKAQFETKFNQFLQDTRNIVKTELITANADIVYFHIHYTYGSVDEFEP